MGGCTTGCGSLLHLCSRCCCNPPILTPPVFNPSAWCRPCKSIEIIGGEVLRCCDCHKHNGLQDNCRRSECRGNMFCRARPWACCRPSQFSNAKHLTFKAMGMQMYLS